MRWLSVGAGTLTTLCEAPFIVRLVCDVCVLLGGGLDQLTRGGLAIFSLPRFSLKMFKQKLMIITKSNKGRTIQSEGNRAQQW